MTTERVTPQDVYKADIVTVTGSIPGVPGKFFKITYPDIDDPIVAQAVLRARRQLQDAFRDAVELNDRE